MEQDGFNGVLNTLLLVDGGLVPHVLTYVNGNLTAVEIIVEEE